MEQIIFARSIARPLFDKLNQQDFVGSVAHLFRRTCNLIDDEGEIITLTTIGQGPFAIVLETSVPFFKRLLTPLLVTHQRMTASLQVGNFQIRWKAAEIWEPRLRDYAHPPPLNSALVRKLQPYADWPPRTTNNASARIIQARSRAAAHRLNQALHQGGHFETIKIAVRQLAGLGNGLTPAGDDYLMGIIAALWLMGRKRIAREIANIAALQTTPLSRAFLQAAGRGEFAAPWHTLVQALYKGHNKAIFQAMSHLEKFGATSGRDALAGFAKTIQILSLPDVKWKKNLNPSPFTNQ